MAKRTSWLAWTVAAVLAVILVVRTGYLILQEHVEMGWETGCLAGMDEAGRLFRVYQQQHVGQFPRRLEKLDRASAHPDILHCPKSRETGTAAYLYIPPRQDAPPDTPIVICWRHPGLVLLTKSLQTELLSDSEAPPQLTPAAFEPEQHGANFVK